MLGGGGEQNNQELPDNVRGLTCFWNMRRKNTAGVFEVKWPRTFQN